MARLTVEIGIKETEAFAVLIGMKKDIQSILDFVPDYYPEKEVLRKSLSAKWSKMSELVEAKSNQRN